MIWQQLEVIEPSPEDIRLENERLKKEIGEEYQKLEKLAKAVQKLKEALP